ncbi:putative mitochondrial intermediate peptidase mitochondrial precursor [Phakopsora pachyrhizi]|uniref:mitochondrial intermediate peptidase n=1 Tax=Phakopsora pachyrhizi TaxID=170000 RepID=A0AAV0AES0_PHAPC|nr:putative mitochondrial intermediate peptidase mitochondrial precursor [Phakopsora pachyrhizi]CAH7666622.1 putative mitochondrial intermediate peptidase mitochondrial precursor [Phakopsora pachyrhizi]
MNSLTRFSWTRVAGQRISGIIPITSIAPVVIPGGNFWATDQRNTHRTYSVSPLKTQDLASHFERDAEDRQIRKVFDTPWQSNSSSKSNSIGSTGIFAYSQLRAPKDLVEISRSTARRCGLIVARICRLFGPSSISTGKGGVDPRQDFLKCVGLFDRLSDGLCRVIDLSELIRNLHPDEKWVEAADQSHDLLCRYMNTLNTHWDLYYALDLVLNRLSELQHDPNLFAARTVALQFLRDFRRHGIHLTSSDRRRLTDLSDRMLLLGRAFFSATEESRALTYVTNQEAGALGSAVKQIFEFDSAGLAQFDPMSWEAHTLLARHPQESVRKRLWFAQNQSTNDQLEVLEALLKTRYEFAKLTGKENWGEVALEDKMAGSPQNVLVFLSRLSAQVRPLALSEVTQLQQAKQLHLGERSVMIYPWDRDFYAAMVNRARQTASSSNLAPYFSVGTCIQGLSRLFSVIYGISFRVESLGPGEVWHDSVIKVGVFDEKQGRIGTIYCDLFDREGKTRGAAHYTILCSRRTDLDDGSVDYEFLEPGSEPLIDDIYLSRTDCELLEVPVFRKSDQEDGTYQRPIVVFSCSFDAPSLTTSQPGLLSWLDVETLFHEMGHAMHSMIGQTDYHNVSGTRCPTDLVELPSILMEHFAASPSVLGLFARHYRDDRPIDLKAFDNHLASQTSFKGLETSAQIVLAALDQHYHTDVVSRKDFDTTREYHAVQDSFGILPSVPGTSSQTKFGHLHGYGASYYSYLFDRAIAGQLWEQVFENNPLDRDSGDRYKEEILRWGGGRESWEGVSNILKDECLRGGGKKAVDKVGSWGLWKEL